MAAQTGLFDAQTGLFEHQTGLERDLFTALPIETGLKTACLAALGGVLMHSMLDVQEV